MLRSRTAKLVFITAALLALYLIGIILRQHYGILIAITNESGGPLREMTVTVRGSERKNIRVIGSLPPGKRTRLFVTAMTESDISVEFVDPTGQHHRETIVGYVEQGYCGRGTARVLLDSTVKTDERIDPVACWGSWFDFW
jgi:hypothetical protein